jgi:hypothetical protein
MSHWETLHPGHSLSHQFPLIWCSSLLLSSQLNYRGVSFDNWPLVCIQLYFVVLAANAFFRLSTVIFIGLASLSIFSFSFFFFSIFVLYVIIVYIFVSWFSEEEYFCLKIQFLVLFLVLSVLSWVFFPTHFKPLSHTSVSYQNTITFFI